MSTYQRYGLIVGFIWQANVDTCQNEEKLDVRLSLLLSPAESTHDIGFAAGTAYDIGKYDIRSATQPALFLIYA